MTDQPAISASAQDRADEQAELASLVEVTSQIDGLAPEDAVFRHPGSGFLVKVKLLRDIAGELAISSPGLCHLSGSIVGPDGKTLRREDDTLALWKQGQTWAHRGHRYMRPDQAADRQRRKCALMTVAAELNRQLFGELGGVATVEDYAARKVAEGEPPHAL